MKPPAQASKPGEPVYDGLVTCGCGKRAYEAKAAAKKAAKRVQTHAGGGALTIYRCQGDGPWHIGHSSLGAHAIAPERRRRR